MLEILFAGGEVRTNPEVLSGQVEYLYTLVADPQVLSGQIEYLYFIPADTYVRSGQIEYLYTTE